MVPPAPTSPHINPYACGTDTEEGDEDGVNNICLTVEDAKAIAKWAREMMEVERAIEACSFVERE